MTTPVHVRLERKAGGVEDLGIKQLPREPELNAEFEFEHDGKTVRARVGGISRYPPKMSGSTAVPHVLAREL